MKKLLLITLLIVFVRLLPAQELYVSTGTYVKAFNDVQLRIANMNMELDAPIIFDTSSNLILAASSDRTLYIYGTASNLDLYNLKINANAQLMNYDSLTIHGSLAFTENGILDLSVTNLYLLGSISGENKDSYLTSSAHGQLIYDALFQLGQTHTLGGIGLDIVPNENAYMRVVRTHEPLYLSSKRSMKKVYSFEQAVPLSRMDVAYHQAVLNDITEPVIYSYSNTDNEWVMNPTVQTKTNRITANGQNNISKVTIFQFPELEYPTYLSDTRRIFEIVGNEKYPNSRLIIINRRGDILYDKSPYLNDFDGTTLAPDTYYFLYYLSKEQQPIKKASFEKITY
jgi:hypothetical protein